MAFRLSFVVICLVGLTGCYTQIRQPGVREAYKPAVSEPAPPVSMQRFEYYNQHVYYDYCDPFYSGSVPFYSSYFPRPYTRRLSWRRDRLIWEYSYWATVYDPWWRGYPPSVLVPRVVYASLPPGYEDPREDLVVPPNPRPNVRSRGTSGPPAPASTIRTGSTTTTSQPAGTSTTAQPKGTSTSPKTQAPSQKKDEEEKREEKRTKRKRRGGMR